MSGQTIQNIERAIKDIDVTIAFHAQMLQQQLKTKKSLEKLLVPEAIAVVKNDVMSKFEAEARIESMKRQGLIK